MSGHGHAHGDASAQSGRLKIALAVTAAIALMELIGGFAANSLALLSDAAHVGMDVVALLIALHAAIQSARLRPTIGKPMGSRGSRSSPASATARCSSP